MRRASLAAAVGALLSAVPLAPLAAQARPLALRTPDAEHAEPFTAVSGVRELRDGRVIVVDRGEKSIQLLDLAAGTATRLGREGGGPNEYRQPNAVFALPGDTTLVHDFGNQRYLTLGPDGRVLGTFTTADPGEGDLMRLLPARGVDGLGNMYFFDSGLRGGPDRPTRMESPDSGTVLRYDRGTKRMTPVGKVAIPKTEVSTSGSSSNQRVMVRMGTPFAAQDVWTVGLDGRLGIVRHDPFRVEWLAPNGQRVTGPTMPYEKIRVTDADKEELR